MNETLITKLDLNGYLDEFKSFLAREKEFFLQGDRALHFKRINELCKVEFKTPPGLKKLDTALLHLGKQGILHLDESAEFVKIFRYFSYLKNLSFGESLNAWLGKIQIPKSLLELCAYFDEKGIFKDDSDERLINLNQALKIKNETIMSELKRLCHSKNLAPYLIDTQIHWINGFETLLARGGFGNFLRAKIVGRSSGGGFYIVPLNIENLRDELQKIKDQKEEIYYEYAKKFSLVLNKELSFLKFIDKSFDIFDHYSARVMFAKKKDFEFILCDNSDEIILKNFAHPALKNPKSVDIEFKKQVLLITGVNAGGKSMLLKSILSAALLAKALLPMQIKATQSKIGSFKAYEAIIEDPQNVKNNISTFAGRMLQISKLFTQKNMLLGIDEIELGTDFEEAGCLYREIILKLVENKLKIIITTHHKLLAMLLAKSDEVELLAALYDEKNSRPKYEFLRGTIGKSYAFETALNYQIPPFLVEKARKNYGEDKSNLEELVSKNIHLELEFRTKLKDLKLKENRADELLNTLKIQREREENEFKIRLRKLEFDFHRAIEEAKKTLSFKDLKDKQRSINKANELKKAIIFPNVKRDIELKIGDFIKYGRIKGKILNISKKDALIESEGLRLRVPLKLLEISSEPVKKMAKTSISVQKPLNLSVNLDLHGLRSDEAIERLDQFISDSLVAGFDEVLVYHGIGSGKLAFAVKEFLKTHKSVKSFSDAPLDQGGFGAKVIRF